LKTKFFSVLSIVLLLVFCCFNCAVGNNIFQGSSEGAVDYVTFGSSVWCGQSFTANSSYVLTSVGLRLLHFSGVASEIIVGLRGTDGAGLPAGSDLVNGSLAGSGLGLDLTGSWFNVSLGNFSVVSGVKYALVARTVGVLDVDGWLVGSQSFLGGNCLGSVDNGTTWSNDAGRDCLFMIYGENETVLPAENLTVKLDSPVNGTVVSTFNCDFNFTPTLLGSGNLQNASLLINGAPVVSNTTTLTNATINTLSYSFSRNGSYLWSIQVYSSVCGVFASENYSLTIEVYVADFCPVNLQIASPTANSTVEQAMVTLEAATNGSGLKVWYRIFNASTLIKGNTTYMESVVLTDLLDGAYRLEAFATNSEGYGASETALFNIELPVEPSNNYLIIAVVVVMAVVVTFICIFLVMRLRKNEDS
jgi:hypothetical protein